MRGKFKSAACPFFCLVLCGGVITVLSSTNSGVLSVLGSTVDEDVDWIKGTRRIGHNRPGWTPLVSLHCKCHASEISLLVTVAERTACESLKGQ